MIESEEKAFSRGVAAAYRRLVTEALGVSEEGDEALRLTARRTLELSEARDKLREMFDENEVSGWDPDLRLGDLIERFARGEKLTC